MQREVRDTGSISGLGRFPGEGHGNPLQSFCLENPMDRGAWQAIVHRVAQSWTWPKWLSRHYSSEISRSWKSRKDCPRAGDESNMMFQYNVLEASLAVQWLKLCLPVQGAQVWSLAGELRSHVSCGVVENFFKILFKQIKINAMCCHESDSETEKGDISRKPGEIQIKTVVLANLP